MTVKELDNYYMQQEEPVRGCFLALRDIILAQDEHIVPAWKWRLPFFFYKKEMFCYLSFHKKYKQPYLAIMDGNQIDHSALLAEDRKRIKIMLIDPAKDIPIKVIQDILGRAIEILY